MLLSGSQVFNPKDKLTLSKNYFIQILGESTRGTDPRLNYSAFFINRLLSSLLILNLPIHKSHRFVSHKQCFPVSLTKQKISREGNWRRNASLQNIS